MDEIEKDRSKSIWEEIEIPQYQSLNENLRTEICIIGGGMSGISTAYQLGKRGHKVILLESSRLASGQSGRTTAHLTYQLEDQLIDLVKQHDYEQLSLFASAHKKAIEIIEENIFLENISCDFKRLDGYLFLGQEGQMETLNEEVKIGKELGLDLQLVTEIPGFPNLGPAVVYPGQGQFHPKKYINGLLRAIKDLDVAIFEMSHVNEFKISDDQAKVVTEEGYEISARFLVVATDSPVNNRFYIHTKQAAYRTYVLGFKMDRKIEVPLLWDTADPYHYIRQSGDVLIVGGEDHRTGQNPKYDPFENLEKWARQQLPMLAEVSYKWSGQVFEPVDQFGYIGRNPGIDKNVFITTGESGIGMTSSTIASLLIPDLIEQIENPWEEIFDPSRVNFKGAKEFIKENVNIAVQYADWMKSSEVSRIEEIPVDHGCLMRDGFSKTCVYHNDTDNFERRSAVCTHLGGIVHWNEFEKTWDCPCHGSRFNPHGKVIEGPAKNDLMES